MILAVFPPTSMDLPDLDWGDDAALIESFMAAYPTPPSHLKLKSNVATGIGDEDVASEAARVLFDDAVGDDELEFEDGTRLEGDPSDEEILSRHESTGANVAGDVSMLRQTLARRQGGSAKLRKQGRTTKTIGLEIPVCPNSVFPYELVDVKEYIYLLIN